MKTVLLVSLWVAGTIAWSAGHAQDWIVFIPAERDFRVLLPEPPARGTAADGSTVFAARMERNDYNITFSVYRLPPGVRMAADARSEIQNRLQARARDEEKGIRYVVRDDDSDTAWERHVFRHGARALSVHRLVGHGGRYFELEVSMPRGSPELALHTARDFFNSFQVTGARLPALGTTVQRIETWCQGRTDPFSRAFCQYSVCLQPGYEKHAHCSALAGLSHFF
ncbi:MAG: hypothetical protein ACT4PS_01230 [Betaproteobacteria bacterium]